MLPLSLQRHEIARHLAMPLNARIVDAGVEASYEDPALLHGHCTDPTPGAAWTSGAKMNVWKPFGIVRGCLVPSQGFAGAPPSAVDYLLSLETEHQSQNKLKYLSRMSCWGVQFLKALSGLLRTTAYRYRCIVNCHQDLSYDRTSLQTSVRTSVQHPYVLFVSSPCDTNKLPGNQFGRTCIKILSLGLSTCLLLLRPSL